MVLNNPLLFCNFKKWYHLQSDYHPTCWFQNRMNIFDLTKSTNSNNKNLWKKKREEIPTYSEQISRRAKPQFCRISTAPFNEPIILQLMQTFLWLLFAKWLYYVLFSRFQLVAVFFYPSCIRTYILFLFIHINDYFFSSLFSRHQQNTYGKFKCTAEA